LNKITNLKADCYCLDLEDAVAEKEKSIARNNIYTFLNDIT